MKKILVTGFEPFHKSTINPTKEIVQRLALEKISGLETAVLPVEFGKSSRILIELIESIKPEVVIALGQAEGRSQITPERIAINLNDARIPDNAGNEPKDEIIVEGGADGLFTTLPINSILNLFKNFEIPAAISSSAGTYVCNHVFYSMQHYCLGRDIQTGFIHVPLMDEQAVEFPGLPTMPLETIVTAIRKVIELLNKP